jgi:hypothetical protein
VAAALAAKRVPIRMLNSNLLMSRIIIMLRTRIKAVK